MTEPQPLRRVTVRELADIMGMPVETVRYHARRGLLAGAAEKVGRDWLIDAEAAEAFARTYDPYMTLRGKRPRRGAPDRPSGAPSEADQMQRGSAHAA